MAPERPVSSVLESMQPILSPLVHGKGPAEWTRAHEALKQDADVWQSLGFDGIQTNGCGGLTELRRCPCCGSTIGRPTTKEQAEALLAHVESVYAISRANLQAA